MSELKDPVLTTIPFAGFYNTWHDQEFDDTLERMFSDRASGCHVNDKLMMRAWQACNWHAAQVEYAKAYADSFAERFKLGPIKFDEMSSPREYNFTTDRIFIYVGADAVKRLMKQVDKKTLDEVARERFTSRSGFISFYRPDFREWGDVTGWDHNQVGTLIEAWARQSCDSRDGFDQSAEFDLMSRHRENGYIDDWIYNNIAEPQRTRIFRVHDYLNDRAERR